MLQINPDSFCPVCYTEDISLYGFTKCVSQHSFCIECVLEISSFKTLGYPKTYKCPIDTLESSNVYHVLNGEIQLQNRNWLSVEYLKFEREKGNNILEKWMNLSRQYDNYVCNFNESIVSRIHHDKILDSTIVHTDVSPEIYIKDLQILEENIRKSKENLEESFIKFIIMLDSEDCKSIEDMISKYILMLSSKFHRRKMENSFRIDAISQAYFQDNEYLQLFPPFQINQYETHCLACYVQLDGVGQLEFSVCHHKLCQQCYYKMDNGHLICPIDLTKYHTNPPNDIINENIYEKDIEDAMKRHKSDITKFYKKDFKFKKCHSFKNICKNLLNKLPLGKTHNNYESFTRTITYQLNQFFNKYYHELLTSENLMAKFFENLKLLYLNHYHHEIWKRDLVTAMKPKNKHDNIADFFRNFLSMQH